MTNFGTDIDLALKAYVENEDKKPYIDPNLTPAQRLQKNQALRAAGKTIPTVGDMKRASVNTTASVKVPTGSGINEKVRERISRT